jgi:WD40 repeat protein
VLEACIDYSSDYVGSYCNSTFTGTSRGSVAVWDLRTDAMMEFQAHNPTAAVSAVTAHPWSQDIVLSASTDGFVTSSNLQRVAMASAQRDPGLMAAGGIDLSTDANSEVLLREPGAITSLDCNRESSSLLATSAVGGLWRLPLPLQT